MVKFYQTSGVFYLEIDDFKLLLPVGWQPVLAGSAGNETLGLQNLGGVERLPQTPVTDIYLQDGVTAHTLETISALLVLYVKSDATTNGIIKVELTPEMQEQEGDDYPITVIHASSPAFMACVLEDKDGYEVNLGSLKQSIYETVEGALVCTSTKFWFPGVNTESYYAYFKLYDTITI